MTSSASVDPILGRLIDGRYEVRSRIARGGMATVYLATDQRLERRVAIKVMHGHLSDDSTFKTRFIQEARSAARLGHPNVVSVFDQGQDDEMAYLVMEYLPGITLRELIRDHGRLTSAQVVDIMDAILSGLAAAHEAGIVHRDLKPENVMLVDDGRIKIGDFGLARAVSAHTGSSQALLGTIAYLSPELVTRGVADTRSDIYALGIMMYEMLTGEQPYKGEQPMQIAYQHANDSVPRPSALAKNVPDELDDLVLWSTERNPEERPADARAMLDRLHEIERGMGLTPVTTRATTILPPELTIDHGETQILTPQRSATAVADPEDALDTLTRRSRRTRNRGVLLFIAILALLGLAGGTGWYFGQGPGSLIAVPETVGLSESDARAVLDTQGLGAVTAPEFSRDVPAGTVLSSDPGAGVRVARDGSVTLVISQGPRIVSIPALAGMTVEEATAALNGIGLSISATNERFDSDAAAGTVLLAQRDGDDADLTAGGEAKDGESLRLTLSAGPIPDVTGQSLEDATAALGAVNLGVEDAPAKEYSTDVSAGRVLRMVVPDGAVTPGARIGLVLSQGPPPVTMPDLAGQNVLTARDSLRALGLLVTVDSALPESFWNLAAVTVAGTDPTAGTSVPHGSTVSIKANI